MNLKKIPSNIYIGLGIVVIFVLWFVFFDKENFLALQSVSEQIVEVEAERDRYREIIRQDSLVICGVEDPAFVEKYARENFFFKTEDESLYLIK